MLHNKKNNIFFLTKNELILELVNLGFKRFVASQIWGWIYSKGVVTFAQMSNVSKNNIDVLNQKFLFERLTAINLTRSFDDTIKFLLKLSDAREVESVYIPEEDRATLCVSSQVGCTLSCKFCHTGTQTLVRNLEPHEIVAQIILTKDLINDWDSQNRKLTNIVFMGLGEPFFNYENVVFVSYAPEISKWLTLEVAPTGVEFFHAKSVVDPE